MISTTKQLENKMLETEIRYRSLFETINTGILILNSKNGQVEDVNPFLEKLLGYSKSDFLRKKIWQTNIFKNIKTGKEVFKKLQRDSCPQCEDLTLKSKDGVFIDVKLISSNYEVENISFMQCIIRGVRKNQENKLATDAENILKENKLRTEFIADVMHELRTPLAIIKGNVDLALRGSLNKADVVSRFKSIDHEMKHLSELLSNLSIIISEDAKFSRKIDSSKINLSKLIRHVVDTCKIVAFKKEISIKIRKMPNVDLVGDKEYLEKLFLNIIKNAITYGKEKGKIEIECFKNKHYVNINISDNGIGMSKEDLPHIFERFYRADKSRFGDRTGLGLAISKWIVESHGGDISVSSVLGKGSVFSVSLPFLS